MLKKISLALALSLSLTLIGCDRDPSRKFDNKLVNQLNEYLKNEQIRYYCLLNGQTYTISNVDDKIFPPTGKCDGNPSLHITDENKIEARRVRNDLIERGILIIDANYADFINNFGKGRSTGNFVADLLELGTSAAIGVIDNVNTLQILGVALTSFRGGRSSFDLNFYEKQTTPILINAMDRSRANLYAVIITKKEKDVYEYSIVEAIKDVVNYYNAETLTRAFAELSKDSAITSREAENNVRKLQGEVSLSLPANKDDRDYAVLALETIRKIEKLLLDTENSTEQKKASDKLKRIYIELNNDSEFKKKLEQYNTTKSQEAQILDTDFTGSTDSTVNPIVGKKLTQALIDIRRRIEDDISKGVDTTLNSPLQNKIDRIIVDFGN